MKQSRTTHPPYTIRVTDAAKTNTPPKLHANLPPIPSTTTSTLPAPHPPFSPQLFIHKHPPYHLHQATSLQPQPPPLPLFPIPHPIPLPPHLPTLPTTTHRPLLLHLPPLPPKPTPTLQVLNPHTFTTPPGLFVHHTPSTTLAPLPLPTKTPFNPYPYSNQLHNPILTSLPTSPIKLHHTSTPPPLPIFTLSSHLSNYTPTMSQRMATASI